MNIIWYFDENRASSIRPRFYWCATSVVYTHPRTTYHDSRCCYACVASHRHAAAVVPYLLIGFRLMHRRARRRNTTILFIYYVVYGLLAIILYVGPKLIRKHTSNPIFPEADHNKRDPIHPLVHSFVNIEHSFQLDFGDLHRTKVHIPRIPPITDSLMLFY